MAPKWGPEWSHFSLLLPSGGPSAMTFCKKGRMSPNPIIYYTLSSFSYPQGHPGRALWWPKCLQKACKRDDQKTSLQKTQNMREMVPKSLRICGLFGFCLLLLATPVPNNAPRHPPWAQSAPKPHNFIKFTSQNIRIS